MKQNGIIMIEVLIALIILAFGILGLASLQAYSLRAAHSSYLRSVATDLANSLAEEIRVNRNSKSAKIEGGQALDENGNPIPLAPDYAQLKCSYALLNPGEYGCADPSGYVNPMSPLNDSYRAIAKIDVARWLDLVKASLPIGSTGGAIICKDNSPDDGTTPIFDPQDPAYSATEGGPGCLLPNDAMYVAAPYVIKIWWEDEKARKDDPATSENEEAPPLTRFATTL
ncbi:type IV pilus modification protein PilV [Chitinilyticum aquatile]|uniref:type IV pilus modification protein PilV n=1 Tax=Chitinilyticum aquatile TaxID=362520 RepID=UPI00048AB210|nr:type IV pilus modification protein PilV [Chitinilyticum aquatile]